MIRLILLFQALLVLSLQAASSQETRLAIGVLRLVPEEPPWVSPLERRPEDEGIAGARLGIQDNQTTGRFLKQSFALTETIVPHGEDPFAAFEKLAESHEIIVLDVPADHLLRMADAARDRGLLLFNAGAADDRLRGADCRQNVLHTAPSRAMLADGLAQYLVFKRWRRWFLMIGRREEDRLYADAIRRAAKKFGARIVAEKTWEFGPDARRTAQSEVPLFTQNVDYEVGIVADELGEFGDLILYRSWEPRLVAGTQGLSPVAWHHTQEQWGAVQFQNRFQRLANRPMRALDYQMWAAVRAIGEAATRTRSTEVKQLRDHIMGPAFELAAFKGVPVSFRPWDQQLRQPIPLAQPAIVVSVSPQAGFLHERTPLDTLGFDQPESACRFATGTAR